MKRDRYDDLPETEVVDGYFVKKLADMYVESKPEFKESFNLNLESVIKEYNEENDTPFQSPDQISADVLEEMKSLNDEFGPFLSNEVKNNIIKSKFNGVSIDFDAQKLVFPESYEKAYNEIHNKANEDT